MVVAALLASLALAVLVVPRLIQWSPRVGLLDRPNSRSLHAETTPRGGGLAIVASALIGMTVWALLADHWNIWPFIAGGAAVAVVGLMDDLTSLPILPRLSVHLLAAALVVWGFGPIRMMGIGPYQLELGFLAIPLSLLWTVGLTNAYNFMDGIDGLAGCQAVAASACWLVALGPSYGAVAVPAALIAGSSLGFLVYNRPPARIFMGDVGSGFLGFSFASLVLIASGSGRPELPIAGALFVGIFVFDTALTLLRRMFEGERLGQAHRSHLYQRLVSAGWSHRGTSILLIVLAAFMGTLGLGVLHGSTTVALASVGLSVVILVAYAAFVTRTERDMRARAR
jgi:UDP-N-acetylmuramyl pentapeptide phosphotransferase/UDP-N-acetylglucosamine-1-phosphate transferase